MVKRPVDIFFLVDISGSMQANVNTIKENILTFIEKSSGLDPRVGLIPFIDEISLYLIHGWLHLIGFDDLEKVERKQMRLEEQKCLEQVRKINSWADFKLAPN